ncbi:unnamed protein product [Chrysoparadoxa australica]
MSSLSENDDKSKREEEEEHEDLATWMVESFEEHRGWEPLPLYDQKRLEEVEGVEGASDVLCYGGTHAANVKERKLRCLYWEEGERRIVRAIWFYKDNKGRWQPYPEEDIRVIENAYITAPTQLKEQKTTTVPLHDKSHSLSMWMERDHVVVKQKGSSAFSSVRDVRRGYPLDEYSEEERRQNDPDSGHHPWDLPITELILVVHGIGEELWSSSTTSVDSMVSSCHKFSEMLDEDLMLRLQVEASKEIADATGQDVDDVILEGGDRTMESVNKAAEKLGGGRSLLLPVHWYAEVHTPEFKAALDAVTLSSIPTLRTFANRAVCDVMVYMSHKQRDNIIRVVGEAMNRYLGTFKSFHPSFDGKVSILSHSLGSIISWDLLSRQPKPAEDGSAAVGGKMAPAPFLAFTPYVLVAIGSPIALFLTVRGEHKNPQHPQGDDWETGKLLEYKLPTCPRFFNVFHPHDPVAYRIEPLLDPRFRNLKPSHVPCQGGGLRAHKQIGEWGSGLAQAFSGFGRVAIVKAATKAFTGQREEEAGQYGEKQVPVAEVAGKMQLNGGNRVDWALQETPVESMQEYISAIASHSSYLYNRDFASFVNETLREGCNA